MTQRRLADKPGVPSTLARRAPTLEHDHPAVAERLNRSLHASLDQPG